LGCKKAHPARLYEFSIERNMGLLYPGLLQIQENGIDGNSVLLYG
jgi:hypothetical protein